MEELKNKDMTPLPGSLEELRVLMDALQNIRLFSKMSYEEQNGLLRILEAYECLAQVEKLLLARILHSKAPVSHMMTDYLWLMRVQYIGLESFEKFLETCQKFVSHVRPTFSLLRMHVVEDIIGLEDYHKHAKVYSFVLDSFVDVVQKSFVAERISLIYEKKLFLEKDVESSYRNLLKIQPTNGKAHRFFKYFYDHQGQWEKVVYHLQQIVEYTTSPFTKLRSAHELAQVYLYRLQKVEACKETLLEYCIPHYPESFTTLLECLEKNIHKEESIKICHDLLSHCRSDEERMKVELKLASFYMDIKDFTKSFLIVKNLILLFPKDLLVNEIYIFILMELKDTKSLKEALVSMVEYVESPLWKKQIEEKIVELQNLGS